jgi:hypothetical protein
VKVIDHSAVGDKKAHWRKRRFSLSRKHPDNDLPSRIIVERALQRTDSVSLKHPWILDFDLKEVRVPIVIDDPVVGPAAIILFANGIKRLGSPVIQALPDALMRLNFVEVVTLAHGAIPCRHGAERPCAAFLSCDCNSEYADRPIP